MTIKELFQPISPDDFKSFADMIAVFQPEFSELTEWNEIKQVDQVGIVLQFSFVTGISIGEITARITYSR